jgi:hypothetical protein
MTVCRTIKAAGSFIFSFYQIVQEKITRSSNQIKTQGDQTNERFNQAPRKN